MDSFHAGNQFTDRCCFHCIGSNRNTGKDSAEESCCKQNKEIQYPRKVRQNINLDSIKNRKHSNIAHSFCTLFRGKQQSSRNHTKNKADQSHSFSACSTHDKNAYDEDEQQFCTRIEPQPLFCFFAEQNFPRHYAIPARWKCFLQMAFPIIPPTRPNTKQATSKIGAIHIGIYVLRVAAYSVPYPSVSITI